MAAKKANIKEYHPKKKKLIEQTPEDSNGGDDKNPLKENEFIQLIVKGKGRENFENYLINNFNKDGRIYEVATDSGVGYRFDTQKDLLTEKNLTEKGFVKHKNTSCNFCLLPAVPQNTS